MSEMEVKYPVVLYKLDAHDPGHIKGAQYRVDAINPEEQFFFKTRQGAMLFMKFHGMKMIEEHDMFELREQHTPPEHFEND